MSDLRDRYLACWNAVDAGERADLIAESWAPGATYVDPLVDVAGTADLSATIAGVHEQFPGFVFTPVGDADAHHGVTRFQWGLGPAGAEPVVVGFDVLTVGADGKITSVAGFLDKVPA
ncbi:MAG TPA: nuclear transport factor 2 family protein [Streptosporangiaceae bacterium]|jgi:hypothetical protein